MSNNGVIERFWSHVDKSGPASYIPLSNCWVWTAVRVKGYGKFGIGNRLNGTKRQVRAHRFSYELSCGPINDGMLICHHCDNPACVRPSHLYSGTSSQNSTDAVSRNRQASGIRTKPHLRAKGDRHGSRTKPESRPSGERCTNSKISVNSVLFIRQSSITGRELGKMFGISNSTISSIKNRKSWKHVA